MIPLSVYDQLARVGPFGYTLWLHHVWPSRGIVSPPSPVPLCLLWCSARGPNELTPLGSLYQHWTPGGAHWNASAT